MGLLHDEVSASWSSRPCASSRSSTPCSSSTSSSCSGGVRNRWEEKKRRKKRKQKKPTEGRLVALLNAIDGRRKMGFFLQLKLILWKNLQVRRRNKIRLSTEILWPLFLFLILMWVRGQGLKQEREECHYLEKAMPSAGQFAFFHSLICNAPNNCHLKNGSIAPPLDDGDRPQLTDLTNEIGRLLADTETLPRLLKNYGDLGNIITTIERNGTFDNLTLRLRDIVLPSKYPGGVAGEGLDQIVDVDKLDKAMQTDDPATYYCRKSSKNAADEEAIMCGKNKSLIWEDINASARTYKDEGLADTLRPSAWHRLQTVIRTMAVDLDSLNLRKLDHEALAVYDRFNGKRDRYKAPVRGWCDLMEYSNETFQQESEFERTLRGEPLQLKARYSADPDEPAECQLMFNATFLSQFKGAPAVWKVVKPFIRGKILFTPDTPAVRSVMERVNATFNNLLSLPGFEGILDYDALFARMEEGFIIQELPKSAAGQNLLRVSVKHNAWFLAPLALRNGAPIKRFRELTSGGGVRFMRRRRDAADAAGKSTDAPRDAPEDAPEDATAAPRPAELINDLLRFLGRFLKCLDRDKIRPVAREDAVEAAMELARTNNLWALVDFETAGDDVLEPFVKYKIRLSAERVDSTMDISDRRTNLRSRDSPIRDLKYLTYGFAYLQDMIDSAILEVHTGRTGDEIPGRMLKQFPYPTFIYDQFIKAISNTFPMFMVLAWVYTSAMVVKGIVYEKEQRIKETLGVMGLGNGVHWAGWFIDSFSCMLISFTLLSAILVYGKIVERSSFTVVWVFLFSFCVATLSLSFLVSVFFSKANVAAAAAGIVYFATHMPYPLILRFADLIPYEGFVGVSFLSNIAFGLGASVFAAYEQGGEGVHWYNVEQPANADELVSLGFCIRMLWVDAFIYGVLTWYIEAVFPGQYGIPKPYLFFLKKSYWCGAPPPDKNNESITANGDVAANNLEPEPSNGVVGVSLEKLSKSFGNKTAVNGLSLNFYQDQITCFLGHNGAGKTTTISMLTGMYPPSSGTARVYGWDIRTDMDSIRTSMGVCPQHNVLFDSLTVEEHLLFFGLIKGLDRATLQQEIDMMLRDMNLEDKRHALTTSLSGGMKRKLSVGMAFVGGSRTVFLDEPTAGVDPFSRRAIWELLIKYRSGRTVILTTHFMDEADLLGDRIAIIGEGRLQCCGSSVFLKSRFGSGYYLTVEWKQQEQQHKDRAARLRRLVQESVRSAQAVKEKGTESVFVLPDRHDVDAITALLEKIDEKREDLGVESYGISDTSLEEIFLKVVQEKEPVANGHEPISQEYVPPRANGSVGNGTPAPPDAETASLSGRALLQQQYVALCRKRFNYVRRDPKGLFTQLVLPALFVALSLFLTSFFNIQSTMPELVLEPKLYGEPVVGFWEWVDEADDLSVRDVYLDSLFRDGVGSELVPERQGMADPRLPNKIQRRIDRMKTSVSPDNKCTHSPPQVDGQEMDIETTLPGKELYYNVTGANIETWIIDTYQKCRRTRLGGVAFGASYPWTRHSNLNVSLLRNKPDNIRVWYDNKGHATSVSYQNAMNNVMLRALLPDEKQNQSRKYGILTSNHPLPLTDEQYKDKTLLEAGIVVFHAITVIFAMSFVPASFVIFLIEDRVGQSKHLQLVSGLRPYVYWFQAYTWDLMSFAASEVMVIGIFIAFQSEMYTSGSNVFALILLIFFYGMACIPLLYLFSWLFQVSSVAFVVLSCGNLFIGMVTTLTVLVLGMFAEPDLQNIQEILEIIFLIFPQYCLGQGIMNMATNHLNAKFLMKQDIVWNKDVLDWSVTGKFIFTLTVICVVLTVAVFLAEQSTHWYLHNHTDAARSSPKEDDVQLEADRVESGRADDDVLVLKKLTKHYRNTAVPAVDGVSFGVSTGQCFGLLGLNGAGKTSIFKMLTGDTNISGGDALVARHSVRADMDGVRKLVGYCPQFDALVPLLTVREHLDLYCSLRGMPPRQRAEAVDRALKRLNLGFYQDKQAKSLSGGNKRKLSTAIALVGDPPLLYMDEPTTSMDPGARRFLWDCVQAVVASGRSVVLTSHSMEECQVLCSKLTIMVNGQLTCFGSPQHLKNKYGSGYSVVVRCRMQRVVEVRALILERLAGSVVVEEHVNQIKFHVHEDLRLVAIFRAMDEARRHGSVLDYSISQTTLEDVFMRFAQMQRADDVGATVKGRLGCLDWLKRWFSTGRQSVPHSPDKMA